jgi:hypothetical protein
MPPGVNEPGRETLLKIADEPADVMQSPANFLASFALGIQPTLSAVEVRVPPGTLLVGRKNDVPLSDLLACPYKYPKLSRETFTFPKKKIRDSCTMLAFA